MHGGVGVERGDGGLDLGLRGVGRQVDADRGDADLGAVAVLAGDVGVAAGVVAHEHRAEPGGDAPLPQPRDPLRELGLDRGRRRLAVEDGRCHVPDPLTTRGRLVAEVGHAAIDDRQVDREVRDVLRGHLHDVVAPGHEVGGGPSRSTPRRPRRRVRRWRCSRSSVSRPVSGATRAERTVVLDVGCVAALRGEEAQARVVRRDRPVGPEHDVGSRAVHVARGHRVRAAVDAETLDHGSLRSGLSQRRWIGCIDGAHALALKRASSWGPAVSMCSMRWRPALPPAAE